MSQKKAHEVDRWLEKPDPRVVVVLVYGPDRGLVSERARRFAQSLGLPVDDPFSVVRLEADAIDGDPGRLLDEAATVSMFGDRRLIWVRNAGSQKGLADAVKLLLGQPMRDTTVLVEASDLKKGAALRTAVENADMAMALPCFPDEGRAIDELIEKVLGEERLSIDPDARTLLKQSLGGDRLASRGEVEKLSLYARGRGVVAKADVEAIVGDASSTSTEDVVDAVLGGQVDAVDSAFARAMGSGANPAQLLAAVMRQVQALEIMRAGMDGSGRNAASAVASARPPIFFKRRDLVERTLQKLEGDALRRIAVRLASAVAETRRMAPLATASTRAALLSVAGDIGRAGRRRN